MTTEEILSRTRLLANEIKVWLRVCAGQRGMVGMLYSN